MAVMDHKHHVALSIALQTHVLCTCPEHHALYCNSDADPASAFALALELVREETPYVDAFSRNPHALTDLLTEVIAAAPEGCPVCRAPSAWAGRDGASGERHRA
jgi:hypothetical protein